MRRLEITATARRDIAAALHHSRTTHGPAAAQRYEALISAALVRLRREPSPPGSRNEPHAACISIPSGSPHDASRIPA